MPRVNTCMLKMKEGRRPQVQVVALLGVVLGLWKRDGGKNLPWWREKMKSQGKSLEAAREVQKYLNFSEHLLPSEKH